MTIPVLTELTVSAGLNARVSEPLNNTLNPAINPVPIANPRIAFLLIIRFFISLSFPLLDVVLPLVCCLGSSSCLMVVFISFSFFFLPGHPVYSR